MQHNLHRELSLDELAQYISLSLSRLHHAFKTEPGMTLACYLRSLRMRKAQELLETTALSVKEIMNSLGIKDRSHFDQDFKKACGLTPVQYRAVMLVISAKNPVKEKEYEYIVGTANK